MTTIVYVANADSGDISVLGLDVRDGALMAWRCVEAGAMVMPLALSPDRRFLYAALRAAPWAVASFVIDATSGRLQRLGQAPLPHSMAYLATDRSGRFLFSASYGGDLIAVSPIAADGSVGPARQVLPTSRHAHAIAADPSNRFVFAACLGGGVVMQMRFDVNTGALGPNVPAELRPHEGASPRHFVFSADTRFVYLLNELDATIDVLAFDAITGTLRTLQTIGSLPSGFSGEPWAADLHLTPDGRFLYSSERRSSTLAMFSVDAVTGELALLGHRPTQAQPRSFAITPDGRFLIAAGQLSHRLGVCTIDAHGGALQACSEIEVGRNPSWVETLTLGSHPIGERAGSR
jgi:6-phosphogluconolactonase